MSLTKVTNSMIDGSVINVFDYGATGDGTTDDTAAIQAAFTYASTTGITCRVPAGTYLITNKIQVSVTSDLCIECDPSAVFKVSAAFPVDTQVFVAIAAVTGEHKFIWKNGTIDGRLIPAKVGAASPDLLSVSGETMRDTLIDNVSFLLNDVLTNNRGDSCLFLTEGQNYTVSNCYFRGAVDAAVYTSGNVAQTAGRKILVTGNTFELCNVAYISKRAFEDQIINGNFVVECNFGIVVGGESDGTLLPGKKTIITSNILKKVEAPIEVRVSNGSVITNNRIEDPGVGPTLIPITGVGIRIKGSNNCLVNSNFIGAINYTPAVNTTGIAISSFVYDSITYTSDNNLIDGNVLFALPNGFFENNAQGSINTVTLTNKYISCTVPVTVQNTGSVNGGKLIGVDPQFQFEIPAGAANQKKWRITAQETQFAITARNDDESGAGAVIGANRVGGVITQLFTSLSSIPEYADNAAASAAGVPTGGFFRTADVVKIRYI